MGRTRGRSAADSRELILGTATELFSQRGYSGVGVDDVAARAGIAKTAIYYHFGSKEGLLAAVLDRSATAWIEGIRAAAQQAGDPLQRLDRALAGMRELLEEKPWLGRLLHLLALEVADDKPEVRAALEGIVRKARDALAAGMRDAVGLAAADADAVAGTMLALYHGIAFGQHIAPGLLPLDAAFAELHRIVVHLVTARLAAAQADAAAVPPAAPDAKGAP